MTVALLTLIAILTRASFSVAQKDMANYVAVSPVTRSFLFTVAALAISIAISPLLGVIPRHGTEHLTLLKLAVVSLSFGLGNILLFVSQGERYKLSVSTTQMTQASSIIWATALAVAAHGLRLNGLQIAGSIALFVIISASQYQRGQATANTGILIATLGAMSFAFFQVFSASLTSRVPAGAYLITTYGAAAALTFAYCAQYSSLRADLRGLRRQLRAAARTSLLAGLTSVGYLIASYYAYRYASNTGDGIIIILLATQVLVSTLLGALILKETERLKINLLAAAAALVSIALIIQPW
jgi:drug/metabolite transporter (DMT)-like permease